MQQWWSWWRWRWRWWSSTDAPVMHLRRVLYHVYVPMKVPLEEHSGELASATGTTIPLGPEFTFVNGSVNANGIEVWIYEWHHC